MIVYLMLYDDLKLKVVLDLPPLEIEMIISRHGFLG